VRILFNRHTAWVDLCEEPEGTELEPWEQEALRVFTDALPNLPKELKVSQGCAFYWLHTAGVWPYDDEEDTRFVEYVLAVPNSESPLPW
jgi:hypothetical protein